MKCFWCMIFGHKYYRGLASWVCTKSCCRGRNDAIIPAPVVPALSWWDGTTSTDPTQPNFVSLDCRDGLHDRCDEEGGCQGCTCHWLTD